MNASRRVTTNELARMRAAGERIAVLTCYDSSFAALCDAAGVDVLLVGDSLGNVLQGRSTTLPVTMEHMAYHTACVAGGLGGGGRAMLMSDLPFGSYQESPAQALRNAVSLMAAGAQMVKLEGGAHMAETVRFLVERGIPVCGHIGLTPQSVHQLGGFRVQGKSEEAARILENDASALEQAGAAMLVLELVPSALATRVTERSERLATIGIGAGPGCHGQVLVLHDLLGVSTGKRPRFVRNFMDGASSVQDAVGRYVTEVKHGRFPAPEHGY